MMDITSTVQVERSCLFRADLFLETNNCSLINFLKFTGLVNIKIKKNFLQSKDSTDISICKYWISCFVYFQKT